MIDKPVYYHVAFFLSINGFGTLGETIFGGKWGKPDEQVLVLNGVGSPADPKETYENPGLQIIVRGKKGLADHEVYTTAKAISDFLLAQLDNVEISGVCYTGFEESSNIANLGKDENERFMYSMNFTTFRNRT